MKKKMGISTQYPYRLLEAFFITLRFKRTGEVDDPLTMQMKTQFRIRREPLPEILHVDLRVESIGSDNLKILVEMVGLFELMKGRSEPSQEIINDFVFEQAIVSMWPLLSSMVRQTTSLMGMQPIKINAPYEFRAEADEEE
jgi:hypothetical protein